jgi:S-disulfanyl-L-cysteine oxidoreductase SoxD
VLGVRRRTPNRRRLHTPDQVTTLELLRTGALAACLGALAGCDASGSKAAVVLRTDDARILATGQSVYQAHCAACHGARLEGQPRWRERDAQGRMPAPPHDATGHTWHHPDQLLFDITKHGVAKAAKLKGYDSTMPTYDGVLSDAEIVAVLSWIKAQWPAEIRKQQEEMNVAAGRKQ